MEEVNSHKKETKIISKSRSKHIYRGIDLTTLTFMQWKPKVYNDPFKFDFEKVKARIEKAEEEGYTSDVETIKRNIKRVINDNPGMFDDFAELL